MINMNYANESDLNFWLSLDKHLSKGELERKILQKQCYIIEYDGKRVGVLRYNLFWDTIPFLNMIFFSPEYRAKGIGRQTMVAWENEMKLLGYVAVMTSTNSDEQAQHFYRKLGYKDCGCLILDIPKMEQPTELFFIKSLLVNK